MTGEGGPGSLWLGPAPPPAPRPSPLPALEHVALTIYGAADAAVRAGEPGRSSNKGPGSGAGAAAASWPSVRRLLPPSVPARTGVERAKGGSGNPALPSRSEAFTCAQVYAGEGNLINAPLKAIPTPTRLWHPRPGEFPKGGGEPGVSHLRAHTARARL